MDVRKPFENCVILASEQYTGIPDRRQTTYHDNSQTLQFKLQRSAENDPGTGKSHAIFGQLQVVQNAAARLVTGARRSEHMTPVPDLHWLPIRQRVTFKTAVLAYKCQHGMAPLYLREYCQPLSSVVRALWSTGRSTNQDELRRPQFRRTGTSEMEQSSC